MKKSKLKPTITRNVPTTDLVDTLNTFIFEPAAKSLSILETIILTVVNDAILIGETAGSIINGRFSQHEKSDHQKSPRSKRTHYSSSLRTVASNYRNAKKNEVSPEGSRHQPNNPVLSQYLPINVQYQCVIEEQPNESQNTFTTILDYSRSALNPDTLYIKEETEVFKDDTFHSFTRRIDDMLRWMHDARHRYFDQRIKPYCR